MDTNFSNIKCLAFDLDETILHSDKTLSRRTRDALAAVSAKGIPLIPVSGRAYDTIPDCIRDLDNAPFLVTSNGAAVYDTKSGERVQEWLLAAKDVRAIMRSVGNFFLEGQITYEAFVSGIPYASADYVAQPARFGIPASAVSYVQRTRRPDRFIIDFIFEHAGKLDSIDLILKEPGLFRMIANTIRRSTGDVYITSSVPYRMEISAKESGKAAGLSWVLNRLGITPEETLVFGDADNDVDMIAMAGIGVALKNASENCRETAAYITDCSCNEDGVADFLEKHLL